VIARRPTCLKTGQFCVSSRESQYRSYGFTCRNRRLAKQSASPSSRSCHPSYTGACLDPNASDYDCAGGSGNGPKYTGPVRVTGPDDYDLDRDGDGYACEN
jgi:hypothetical protein